MSLFFEWDEIKAEINFRKHAVHFEEAAPVLGDPYEIMMHDSVHSRQEDRFISMGHSSRNRLLVVIYTERSINTRIISARLATKKERRNYDRTK